MPRQQYRTVIKREHPQRRRMLWAVSILLVAAAISLAYLAGEQHGSREPVPWTGEADQLRDELAQAETSAVIDAQATRELTESLAEARGIIEERERELAFYKEVLAPEELSRGPRLRQPVFSATDQPGVWRYQLVVQQGGKTSSGYRGDMDVSFMGFLAGEITTLRLSELDQRLKGTPITLNFRYFQRAEGEIEFPLGFSPDQVEVVVDISKPALEDIRTGYIWNELVLR